MSKIPSGSPGFWARLFGRGRGSRDFGAAEADHDQPATGVAAMVDELAGRVQRAAESILESEGLAGDLDDTAAQALLEWGVACAKKTAQATSGLTQVEAEATMADRLRAVRRMLRLVNGWAASGPDRATGGQAGGAAWLDQVLEQAAVVYGAAFTPPDAARRAAFLGQVAGLADNPPGKIASLRALLEDS
jgi:hypothetical protein